MKNIKESSYSTSSVYRFSRHGLDSNENESQWNCCKDTFRLKGMKVLFRMLTNLKATKNEVKPKQFSSMYSSGRDHTLIFRDECTERSV